MHWQDMTAFIDAFDGTRAGILAEQQTAQDTIVLLLEDISKGLEDTTNMPSQETHAEMEEAMVRLLCCSLLPLQLPVPYFFFYLSLSVCADLQETHPGGGPGHHEAAAGGARQEREGARLAAHLRAKDHCRAGAA